MKILKRILEKYERGIFQYENPLLDFSCTKIEIKANKDEIVNGSFQIRMPSNDKLEGYLHSSSLRMHCSIGEYYEESNSYQVSYNFDAHSLEEGTSFTGDICFITTLGEYYISFIANISLFCMESSIGKIKNLFHFTNLAKSNWTEAVRMFYAPLFHSVFRGNEQSHINLYRGLAHEVGNEKNLDEFLFLINKKERVDFLVNESEIIIDDIENQSVNRIHIKRNGWGYTNLSIEVSGDFISVEKEQLIDDDFLGNDCSLQFVIDEYSLHPGTNYGEIILFYGIKEISVPITVHQFANSKEKKVLQMKHEAQLIMTTYYIDFRTKTTTAKEWAKRSLELIEKITLEDEKNYIARLYQAQMLISTERNNEAKWILDRIENLLPDDVSPQYHAYYLYLTTLINREQNYVNQVTGIISGYSRVDPQNWRLAWFLLYLAEEYTSNPHKRWKKIEELVMKGSNSPILLVDAVNLMNGNVRFLTKLEGFDLRVINYALKKKIIGKEVFDQILYLLIKVKDCTDQLLFMLFKIYEIWNNNELLEEICKVLIRKNKTDNNYYIWYERAIEKEFRITKLFEYYLIARPITCEKEIPRMILLYFAYDCNLPYEVVGRLYRYIYSRRKENMEMYRSYKNAIIEFIQKQVDAKHMNDDLAFLYEELLTQEMMNQERAESLATIAFLHKIKVEIPQILQIVLIYEQLKGENRYFLQDKETVFPIFGNGYHIFFQDSYGNRYDLENYFTITEWLNPTKVVNLIKPYLIPQIGYSMYMCEDMGEYTIITPEIEYYYANLLNSTQVIGTYKRRIRAKLLPYYYEEDMMQEMDECLLAVPFKETTVSERKELIRFMVLRGMYSQAYDWIIKNGANGMDPKTIYRMASRMIRRGECSKFDEKMLEIIYFAFKNGEKDEFTVGYLVKHFEGMVKELRDIWKAGKEEDLDVHELEERILVQILFSGAYILEKQDIFYEYCKGTTNAKLVDAYLSLHAYEYFVKEKVIDGKMFLYYLPISLEGKEVNEICILALTKYFSENQELIDENARKFIWKVYCEYSNRGIFLPMFVDLSKTEPKMFGLQEKTFIEYRCDPKKEVTIHYILERENEETGQYRKEKMKNVCYGIFVKDFVLFFGETLQYYITEEINGEEQLTESGEISKADIMAENNGLRYFALNDISIANTLQDFETVNRLSEEYSCKAYLTRRLFRMI